MSQQYVRSFFAHAYKTVVSTIVLLIVTIRIVCENCNELMLTIIFDVISTIFTVLANRTMYNHFICMGEK